MLLYFSFLPPNFLNVEVNIVDDMTKCRASINQRDWKELAAAVKSIQAKAQRMCHVSMNKAATMTDPIQKNSVKIAVAELDKGEEERERKRERERERERKES